MTRQIILHIGAPKAGSTFLQRVLLRNGPALVAAGIVYPHDGGNHPGNAGDLSTMTAAVLQALFTDGAETLVLSHEDLFAQDLLARPLMRAARDLDIPIRKLVFLRPWSEFCTGDFSQHLKQNFARYLDARRAFDGRSFEAMAARRAAQLDPAAAFMRWVRLIPVPPLTLASHRAIEGTVEAMLGHPGLDWTLPRHLANPSLRLCDCEAIAAMIDDPAIPEDAVRAAFQDAHHTTADPDPARTPDRMARIEALFARHNTALRDIYQFDNRADPTAPCY